MFYRIFNLFSSQISLICVCKVCNEFRYFSNATVESKNRHMAMADNKTRLSKMSKNVKETNIPRTLIKYRFPKGFRASGFRPKNAELQGSKTKISGSH